MNANPLTHLTHTFKRVHVQAFDLTIIPSSDYNLKVCKKCKTETEQEHEQKEHETVYSYDLIKVSMLSKDTVHEQERPIDEMNKEQEFYKLAQDWGVVGRRTKSH